MRGEGAHCKVPPSKARRSSRQRWRWPWEQHFTACRPPVLLGGSEADRGHCADKPAEMVRHRPRRIHAWTRHLTNRVASRRVASRRIASRHVASCRMVSRRVVTCRHVALRCVASCRVASCCVASRRVHVMLLLAMSRRGMSRYASGYVPAGQVRSGHVKSCHLLWLGCHWATSIATSQKLCKTQYFCHVVRFRCRPGIPRMKPRGR